MMNTPATRRILASLVLEASILTLGACARGKPPPPAPPAVTVAPPLAMELVDWDDYDGQFTALDSVDVRPRVSGYLMSVGFKDGDYVRKGQVLFVIDPRPYRAALDQAKGQEIHAQAALATARSQLARGRTLIAAHAISEQAYEALVGAERQAAADLASAQATVRTNALNLEFTRVTAPMVGRVSDRRVAPGNLVTADTTILTNIVNLDPIRFDFTVPEANYLRYQVETANGSHPSQRRAASPVEVRLQDETTWRWRGRMDFIDNAIDTGSGTIRARARIDNPDHFLTPGMFGHLRLAGSGAYRAALVPDSALITDLSRQVLYVLGPGGKVAQKVVTPGPVYRGLRVIRSGVAPTDLVVIDGVQKVKPGQAARVLRGRITPLAAPAAGDQGGYVTPQPSSASPADEIAGGR
jgi:RND family efflux transporter MFP subunit